MLLVFARLLGLQKANLLQTFVWETESRPGPNWTAPIEVRYRVRSAMIGPGQATKQTWSADVANFSTVDSVQTNVFIVQRPYQYY